MENYDQQINEKNDEKSDKNNDKKDEKTIKDYRIYKWLAALYGSKCTVRNKSPKNMIETTIETYIEKAKETIPKNNIDDHLTFLDLKLKCKVIYYN